VFGFGAERAEQLYTRIEDQIYRAAARDRGAGRADLMSDIGIAKSSCTAVAKPCHSRYEAALAFNRNWVEVVSGLPICKSYAGYLQELRQVLE
jgi:hypothetical protein